MFNSKRVKELIDNSKLSDERFTVTAFCKRVELTAAGLKGITERGAMPRVDTLEKIANYFGKDLNYFFDLDNKKAEVESVSIKMTDGNEYILKRFEELIQENTRLTDRVKELEGLKKYTTLQNVSIGKVAEPSVKLKK